MSQVGSKQKEFGVEFYFPSWNLQERGGSKQLHWLWSWIFFFFFFGCTKQLLEQQFLVRSLPGGILGRDPQEEAAKTIPEQEGGLGAALELLSCREAPSDGSCEPREDLESRNGLGFPTAGMWEAVRLWEDDFDQHR